MSAFTTITVPAQAAPHVKQALWDRIWDVYHDLAAKGQFFSVAFERRTTRKDGTAKAGEVRHMVCRAGVKKHLAGGKAAYDPKAKRLLLVWDVEAYKKNMDKGMAPEHAGRKAYRSIPVDSLLEISLDVPAWVSLVRMAI